MGATPSAERTTWTRPMALRASFSLLASGAWGACLGYFPDQLPGTEPWGLLWFVAGWGAFGASVGAAEELACPLNRGPLIRGPLRAALCGLILFPVGAAFVQWLRWLSGVNHGGTIAGAVGGLLGVLLYGCVYLIRWCVVTTGWVMSRFADRPPPPLDPEN